MGLLGGLLRNASGDTDFVKCGYCGCMVKLAPVCSQCGAQLSFGNDCTANEVPCAFYHKSPSFNQDSYIKFYSNMFRVGEAVGLAFNGQCGEVAPSEVVQRYAKTCLLLALHKDNLLSTEWSEYMYDNAQFLESSILKLKGYSSFKNEWQITHLPVTAGFAYVSDGESCQARGGSYLEALVFNLSWLLSPLQNVYALLTSSNPFAEQYDIPFEQAFIPSYFRDECSKLFADSKVLKWRDSVNDFRGLLDKERYRKKVFGYYRELTTYSAPDLDSIRGFSDEGEAVADLYVAIQHRCLYEMSKLLSVDWIGSTVAEVVGALPSPIDVEVFHVE